MIKTKGTSKWCALNIEEGYKNEYAGYLESNI